MKYTLKPKKPVVYEAIQLRKDFNIAIDGRNLEAKAGQWLVIGDNDSFELYSNEDFEDKFITKDIEDYNKTIKNWEKIFGKFNDDKYVDYVDVDDEDFKKNPRISYKFKNNDKDSFFNWMFMNL